MSEDLEQLHVHLDWHMKNNQEILTLQNLDQDFTTHRYLHVFVLMYVLIPIPGKISFQKKFSHLSKLINYRSLKNLIDFY